MHEALYFHMQNAQAIARMRAGILQCGAVLPWEVRAVYNQICDMLPLNPDFLDISQVLGRIGRRIDRGSMSTIFRCGNVVCKVANVDRGYPVFVRHALENQHNPHYPRIYLHRTFDPRGFHLTLMEPLQPIRTTSHYTLFNRQVAMSRQLCGYGQFSVRESALFRQAVQQVRQVWQTSGVLLDAKPDSIMYRPETDTLVVTDPYIA